MRGKGGRVLYTSVSENGAGLLRAGRFRTRNPDAITRGKEVAESCRVDCARSAQAIYEYGEERRSRRIARWIPLTMNRTGRELCFPNRSEERRVGKECRARVSPLR